MDERSALLAARLQRQRIAKQAIAALAGAGPRFLYSKSDDRSSQLVVDRFAQVWYIDGFTGLMLYPFDGQTWVGFSSGPELKPVVMALASYVRDGQLVDLALVDSACADAYGKHWPGVRAMLEVLDGFTVGEPA